MQKRKWHGVRPEPENGAPLAVSDEIGGFGAQWMAEDEICERTFEFFRTIPAGNIVRILA
ncbi:MAG TPA: hypothetical protein VJT54_03170 [Verrucomicrobiae bacterium]|nr:hypothetical protein [Verrucomicrobiae bacterium]